MPLHAGFLCFAPCLHDRSHIIALSNPLRQR